MAEIRIACAALSKTIYAGRVNKAGDSFLDGKQDVTSDVLKAIIDKVEPGNIETVTVDGKPTFEIEVRECGKPSLLREALTAVLDGVGYTCPVCMVDGTESQKHAEGCIVGKALGA